MEMRTRIHRGRCQNALRSHLAHLFANKPIRVYYFNSIHGYVHTATVFSAEFAFAAVGGPLPEVQGDCGADNYRSAGTSGRRNYGRRLPDQVARLGERRALDIKSLHPYSFPFRTTV